jgi:hypothetical protein
MADPALLEGRDFTACSAVLMLRIEVMNHRVKALLANVIIRAP